jgi:hypothetical protein
MQKFLFKLKQAHHDGGYFWVPKDDLGHLQLRDNEPVTIYCGNEGIRIDAWFDCKADSNGPCIKGELRFKNWLQKTYEVADMVPVIVVNKNTLIIGVWL